MRIIVGLNGYTIFLIETLYREANMAQYSVFLP